MTFEEYSILSSLSNGGVGCGRTPLTNEIDRVVATWSFRMCFLSWELMRERTLRLIICLGILIDKQILLKILAQCFSPSLRKEEVFLRFFSLKHTSCLSLGKTPWAAAVSRSSPLEPSLKTVILGSPGCFCPFSNQIEPFYILLNSFAFKNNYSFNNNNLK